MKGWILILLLALVIVFGLFFVGSTMYSGETYTYSTDIKNVSWEVEGNSSNLEGLNISHIGNEIILDFDLNFKSDNFTLTFHENFKEEEVVVYHGGGSNSGNWILQKEVENNVSNYIEENETEVVTKEPVPQEPQEPKKSISLYVFIFLFVLIFVGFIIWLVLRNKDDLEVVNQISLTEGERRLEQNEKDI